MSDRPTDNDHDLLIRLDERAAAILSWTKLHDARHDNHETSHKRTMKVLTGIAAGIGAAVAFFTNLLTGNR